MNPMVRNTDLKMAIIDLKRSCKNLLPNIFYSLTFMSRFVAGTITIISRQLFGSFVVLDFVLPNEDRGEVFYSER